MKKKATIMLINNERKSMSIHSEKACSYDHCVDGDLAYCDLYSTDYCWGKDLAACINHSKDYCSGYYDTHSCIDGNNDY